MPARAPLTLLPPLGCSSVDAGTTFLTGAQLEARAASKGARRRRRQLSELTARTGEESSGSLHNATLALALLRTPGLQRAGNLPQLTSCPGGNGDMCVAPPQPPRPHTNGLMRDPSSAKH